MCKPFKPSLWILSFGVSIVFGVVANTAIAQSEETGNSTVQTDNTPSDRDRERDAANDEEVVAFPQPKEFEEVPGNNNIPAREIPESRKEKLQRRAGEKVAGEAKGSAIVLGMHIQETDAERAKVTEVAAASPAFDAGIRAGDEILSFDGFKAKTYRKWIDGMRKLATDAPDGDTLPIAVQRGDERLQLRVRVPVSRVGYVPPADEDVTLNQTIVPGQPGQPGVVAGGQQPIPYGGGAGDNVLIADAFGDEFNDPNGTTTEAAIAEIFRINRNTVAPVSQEPAGAVTRTNPQPSNPQPQRGGPRANARTAGGTPGERIGLAGMRDDANGLFVMLDVGNLEPGNYIVGIDDPSVLTAFGDRGTTIPNRARGTTAPTNRATPPTRTDLPDTRGGVAPFQNAPRTNAPRSNTVPANPAPASQPANGNATPAGGGASPAGSTPQSSIDRNNFDEVPPTVLAQVTETPATREVNQQDVPATGQINPQEVPATGQLTPSDATPTGLPRNSNQAAASNDVIDGSGIPGGGVGPAIRIGTLTVDQSGTGRLQQVVETVRVQDVVGQAIAIYSQGGTSGTTLPSNLDATIDPTTGGQRVPAQPNTEATVVGQPPATNGVNGQGMRPIAAGLIRMMSATPGGTQGTTTDTNLPSPQSPNVPQNSGVPATPNRLPVR